MCSAAELDTVATIYANLFDYYRLLAGSSIVAFRDTPRIKWITTGIPDPFLNRVFQTRLASQAVTEAIANTVAHFQSRDVPFVWMAEPGTEPPDLGKHLEAHGFTRRSDLRGMAKLVMGTEATLPSPPGLIIRPVHDNETLRQWLDPYILGFGLTAFRERYFAIESEIGLSPDLPRRHFVGFIDRRPVASSTLFLGAGVAGIYNVATISEARRRGIGAAMTSRCVREAAELGHRLAVLEASPMGFPVYRRLGFSECCRLNAYVWTGDS